MKNYNIKQPIQHCYDMGTIWVGTLNEVSCASSLALVNSKWGPLEVLFCLVLTQSKFRCWPLFSVIQFCCCIVLFLFRVIYDVHVLFLESYWRSYLLLQYGLTPIEIAALQCNYQGVVILFPVTSRNVSYSRLEYRWNNGAYSLWRATQQVIKCNPPLKIMRFWGKFCRIGSNHTEGNQELLNLWLLSIILTVQL